MTRHAAPVLLALSCVLSSDAWGGDAPAPPVIAPRPNQTATPNQVVVPPGKRMPAPQPVEDPKTPAPAPAGERPHLSAAEVFNHMLPSTVWLRYEYTGEDGQVWERVGTGWVYDVQRRLVITNEHVIEGRDDVSAYMPERWDGQELVHDPSWYLQFGQRYTATVIDRDALRDLALLQLDSLPQDAVALTLAEKSPSPGERVFALGGLPEGSEGLWILTSGEVRQVYRRRQAKGQFARIVETQLPTNRGNSGGAVVNDQLDVVAVVEGHMAEARLVSMFIDVTEVRDYLAEALPFVDPTTAEQFMARASRRKEAGRLDQAIADYTEALKLDASAAMALINRGWCFYTKEDYATGLADFDAALQLDGESAAAYEGRGTCHREMGDYDSAIRDLTEAIRRDPTEAANYQRRGTAYEYAERLEEALKDRNRTIELNPEEFDYWIQRGQTLRQLKRYGEARRDLEQAISMAPASAHPYYEMGYVYYEEENWQSGVLFFTLAIERDAQRTSYWNMRGLCYRQLEEYDEAVTDFLKAVTINPKEPLYHWHLGLCFWDTNEMELALKAFNNYVDLAPDDPEGYDWRADVYEEMGDNDSAEADREKMRELQGAATEE